MEKKIIHFDVEYFQNTNIVGCDMITDLAVEVEFTEQQIDLMRQLVSQVDEDLYSDGILSILKEAAPELYVEIDDAARSALFDFLVINSIRNGNIELSEKDLQRNFELDVKNGTFEFVDYESLESFEQPTEEELNEQMFNAWYEKEMSRVQNEDPEWVRSRYYVEDQVEMPEELFYVCEIPVEFLP